MRRRVDQRMWLTWQEAYCEAVAHDASTALRGLALVAGFLVLALVVAPTPLVVFFAVPAGAAIAWRVVRWSRLLIAARAGRLYPPR